MLHEGQSSVLTHSANVAVNSRLTTVQTNGDRQPVAPVKPWPPHWPYLGEVAPEEPPLPPVDPVDVGAEEPTVEVGAEALVVVVVLPPVEPPEAAPLERVS